MTTFPAYFKVHPVRGSVVAIYAIGLSKWLADAWIERYIDPNIVENKLNVVEKELGAMKKEIEQVKQLLLEEFKDSPRGVSAAKEI